MINFDTTRKQDEVEKFGILVGTIQIMSKEEIIAELKQMPGFIGVTPNGMTTGLLFETENDAKRCRNMLKARKIKASSVSNVYVDRKYLNNAANAMAEEQQKSIEEQAKEERFAKLDAIEDSYKQEIKKLNELLVATSKEVETYKSLYKQTKTDFDRKIAYERQRIDKLTKENQILEHKIDVLSEQLMFRKDSV